MKKKTVEQAKQELEALEAAINNLIWNFEQQTGLVVDSVNVRTIEHHGNKQVIAVNHIVNVEAKIK